LKIEVAILLYIAAAITSHYSIGQLPIIDSYR